MADDFKRRTIFVIAASSAVTVAATFIWMARVILLLLFAGLIGALLLSIVTNWTQQKLKLRRGLALATVVVSFVICLSLGIWIRGPALAHQFSDLQIDLPSAAHKVLTGLQAQGWASWLLSRYSDQAQLSDGLSYALTRIGGVVVTTASAVVGIFVVVAVSLYVAAEPSSYLRGLRRITPLAYRPKLDQCLANATQMLQSWLIAKAISMVTVGALIAVGLWTLQIPLAGTLGIIAGLLTFIPNLGPVISFMPAGLLAFAISPMKGVLTLLLFCTAHLLEGNVITPLLEWKIVTLPPALTLAVQLLLASVTGAIGVALAAPLTAVALGILQVFLPSESQLRYDLSHKQAESSNAARIVENK
ncbi:MAG TPA: AI-2E family transporter [Terracidiphilus sp.]|nr:AI-2E family transporter [Terracidiphilus sp.]